MEIRPHLHRLPLPLGNNPLGFTNAYLVTGGDGFLLVDCGWDSPAIRETLNAGLAELGLAWTGLRTLLLTHAHPDHYGASGWVKSLAPQAEVVVHRAELPSMRGRYRPERLQEGVEEMTAWLWTHGVPDDDAPNMSMARASFAGLPPARPDRLLHGGERIVHGDFAFDVHWTPGHAAGQVCLHDRRHRVLLSADHVLPRITPSVAMHPHASANPLADYVDSLLAIRALDGEVDLVLPGHRDPFPGLADRIDVILKHHDERLAEMLAAVERDGAGRTAHEVAAGVSWRGGRQTWQALSPFDRRLAVMETLSHLELLHGRGALRKHFADGHVRYTRLPDAAA